MSAFPGWAPKCPSGAHGDSWGRWKSLLCVFRVFSEFVTGARRHRCSEIFLCCISRGRVRSGLLAKPVFEIWKVKVDGVLQGNLRNREVPRRAELSGIRLLCSGFFVRSGCFSLGSPGSDVCRVVCVLPGQTCVGLCVQQHDCKLLSFLGS